MHESLFHELNMLLNNSHNKIIDSCGWVDHSSLLVIDLLSRKSTHIKISDCSYISLKALSQELFISVEHFSGEQLVLNVRPFDAPSSILAGVAATANSLVFSGDDALWENAPRYYVEYLRNDSHGDDYRLIDLHSEPGTTIFPILNWYDESYDQGYQGVLDVIEIPETGHLLFSVQRSSSPVLYDPVKGVKIRTIDLAGRAGNPIFSFNRSKTQLWCVDYDTLLTIKVSDFEILKSRRLQDHISGGVQQFIGEFSLSPDEIHCAVARPHSGDVVLLDSVSFRVVSSARSEKQPSDVALLPNLEYVCRDWMSGVVEFGRFDL